jgi:twitching motility protein PilT
MSALREDPDVILVGELRDLETMSIAVTAAEMGILVMGTCTPTAPRPPWTAWSTRFPRTSSRTYAPCSRPACAASSRSS